MIELYRAFAAYNRAVNEKIASHLRSMDEAKLRAEHPTYYKSIFATLLHPLRSDIRWVQRLEEGAGASFSNLDLEKLGITEYLKVRPQVDAEIVRVIGGKTDAQLAADFTMVFGQRTVEAPLWKLLLQWFNHQTHHRGQVSVLLDLEGVDNDFSGMLDKI